MFDSMASMNRLMAVAADNARTSTRTTQMLTASRDVIEVRGEMIGKAMRSPLTGDYAELARMVPEKVEAFARSGSALFGEWWSMQVAWLAHAQRLGTMAMSGRAPGLAEAAAFSDSATAFTIEMIERGARLGATALAPIHASATANARRLKAR